ILWHGFSASVRDRYEHVCQVASVRAHAPGINLLTSGSKVPIRWSKRRREWELVWLITGVRCSPGAHWSARLRENGPRPFSPKSAFPQTLGESVASFGQTRGLSPPLLMAAERGGRRFCAGQKSRFSVPTHQSPGAT